MSFMLPTSKTPFVFFGTPQFAVFVLEEFLSAGLLPSLIVTMPDQRAGRGMKLSSLPVTVWAKEQGIPVLQPEELDSAFLNTLQEKQWDVFVVAAYGKILPKELLGIPKHGVLNVHPSLLPKLRGASPVRSAILENVPETGVTIMPMDEKMAPGPTAPRAKNAIALVDWPPRASFLEEMLAREGGKLLADILPDWTAGKIIPEPQDDRKATFCKKIKKEDGLIDLSADPYQNFLKISAFDGWPGTFFFSKRHGKDIRVKITDAGFKDGKLLIKKVIPEGKREMNYRDFFAST